MTPADELWEGGLVPKGPWQPMTVEDEGSVVPIGVPGPPGPMGPPGPPLIASIAALRAFPTFPETLQVQSYYGDGGHGGGLFRWDVASSVADDGGAVIKPTAVSGAGRWIRVY